ncbi:calreticulin-3 isoform X1 [Sarcophilus harrisii]|uniref:calreticulin-3 isoform X1 n=1 Tax=Sarcophilus harrisii TaxID=9305 RepID=UPI001301FBA1|nr:calreticulin-3 isoform X1 [Sarcophilus harrisii]
MVQVLVPGPLWVLWLVRAALATVYFQEEFLDGESWRNRWIPSTNDSNFGHFRLSSGKFYGDIQKDKGLQTTENAKFYAISSRFKPFSNKGKTLVIQYTVKHEQKMDCGGGYIKIFPSDLDQKNLNGKSQYYIMFGPDICGFDIKKVHVILFYKDQYHSNKKPIRCKVDGFTHLYTLTLRPDLTYEVKIDTDIIESGNIEEDWNLRLRKLEKSAMKMPKNWEKSQNDKLSDVPSQDWDKHFLDASANKPSDWNSELDGEWQPSVIQQTKYKHGLKSQNMDNSDYKDVWLHQKIESSGYLQDFELSEYENIGVIGLELWQVRSGTIFDNFLITDDENYAAEFGLKTWGRTKNTYFFSKPSSSPTFYLKPFLIHKIQGDFLKKQNSEENSKEDLRTLHKGQRLLPNQSSMASERVEERKQVKHQTFSKLLLHSSYYARCWGYKYDK